MAETKTINLDVETNLGSLRSQLREAQQQVAILSEKFGVASTEAANAAKKAAELKDRIEDAKKLTDAFNPDAKFNALSGAIGGVLNGFQAYEGALGIIGVDSKELEATLLKVQSAMALSQGIQGAMEAKDAFIALGSVVKNAFVGMTAASRAFAITGVGLVVTAIGGLVYAYQTMNDEAEKAAQAQKTLDTNIKHTNESIENQKETIDAVNSILDLETRRIIAEAKKRGASETELARITIQAKKDRLESLKDEVEQARKLYIQKSKYGTNEEYEASRKAFLDIQKTYNELEVSLLEDQADLIVKAREKALKKPKKTEFEPVDILKPNELKVIADENLQTLEKYTESAGSLSDQLATKMAENAEKSVALTRAEQQKKLQLTIDALNIINGAVDLFSVKNEKQARTQFKVNKALNLATALMNTALAVTSALATTKEIFPGQRFVEAGLAGAAGAVQIAKISQTQFNAGGGGGNLSPNAPSGATGTTAPNLSFSMQGGGTTNQLLSSVLGQPIKAYVVSSDITSAQMLDAKAIKTSVL